MLVVVAFAFRGAGVADAGAQHERMHWRMSMPSAEQASAQLRHIFAQYIKGCTASPSG